jgi:hypothetical protein
MLGCKLEGEVTEEYRYVRDLDSHFCPWTQTEDPRTVVTAILCPMHPYVRCEGCSMDPHGISACHGRYG